MTGTDIALWGAVIGTLTLLLNVSKGRREMPRVVATVEALESYTQSSGFVGIRFTLRNRGGKRTTIERVLLYRRQRWFEFGWRGCLLRLFREVPWQQDVGVSAPKTVNLPAPIDSGGLWEGFISLDKDDESGISEPFNRTIQDLIAEGKLRYSIISSHTSQKLKGVVRIRDSFPSE